MEKSSDPTLRNISDLTKIAFLIGTAIVSITIYIHSTFATENKVEKLEEDITKQAKISCLIALKLNIEKDDLRGMCNLKL